MACTQLHETIPCISLTCLIQVEATIADREVDMALSISSRSRSTHPYPPFLPIGRRVKDTYLLKCCAIVGVTYNPTMVGVSITKASPCDVDHTIHEQQCWSLIGFPAIKRNYRGCTFALVITCSLYARENGDRAAWLICACRDIKRVQSLHILVAMFLRHCHYIDGVGGQINDGGGSDPNRGLDILMRILPKHIRRGDSRHLGEMEKARLPQWGNHMHLISIKGVDTVVFRRHIDHIGMMTFNKDIRDKERLCIHLSINRIRDPFAEALCTDIARVKKLLVEILSCA